WLLVGGRCWRHDRDARAGNGGARAWTDRHRVVPGGQCRSGTEWVGAQVHLQRQLASGRDPHARPLDLHVATGVGEIAYQMLARPGVEARAADLHIAKARVARIAQHWCIVRRLQERADRRLLLRDRRGLRVRRGTLGVRLSVGQHRASQTQPGRQRDQCEYAQHEFLRTLFAKRHILTPRARRELQTHSINVTSRDTRAGSTRPTAAVWSAWAMAAERGWW